MSIFLPLSVDSQLIYDWTNDTDPDDLGELFNINLSEDNQILPIDYKSISMILLLEYYNKYNQYKNLYKNVNYLNLYNKILSELDSIINIILSKIDAKNTTKYNINKKYIIEKLIKNAISLYENFFILPTAQQMNRSNEIILYSGIRSYKMIIKNNLDNLLINELWYLPTFISSTLSIDTALRFQDKNDRGIMRFRIPEDKLSIFKYVPLFEETKHYPQTLEDSIRENEFLLPPYSEFILKRVAEHDIKYYHWEMDFINGKFIPMPTEGKTKIYELEFVSFGKKSPDDLNKELLSNLNLFLPYSKKKSSKKSVTKTIRKKTIRKKTKKGGRKTRKVKKNKKIKNKK